jgi:SRSO17 transposase
MTEQEITALGPAFASYFRRFRGSFGQDRTAKHFDTFCRGLMSDLPRKCVEPIALAAGTAVRILQEFLVTAQWGIGIPDAHRSKRLASHGRTCDAFAILGKVRASAAIFDFRVERLSGHALPGHL